VCPHCCFTLPGIFGDSSNCGKLHGKLKGPEKAEVLEHFKRCVCKPSDRSDASSTRCLNLAAVHPKTVIDLPPKLLIPGSGQLQMAHYHASVFWPCVHKHRVSNQGGDQY
jgi:hypothetical protein